MKKRKRLNGRDNPTRHGATYIAISNPGARQSFLICLDVPQYTVVWIVSSKV